MLALVIVLLVVVGLVCVVVTGLLRSHADILRSLHQLGVGVGDPTLDGGSVGPQPVAMPRTARAAMPSERSATSVHDVEGVSVGGDPLVVSVQAAPLTLFAFLSSGCNSCAAIWSALGDDDQLRLLPQGTRVVAVTKGPEFESPSAVASRAPRGVTVVMSTAAWGDYEVPGSPFFALVDGLAGRRAGEGVANQFSQVADLVRRSSADEISPTRAMPGRAAASGLDGPEREAANDAELRAAGITPHHPSLYPASLDDIFASTAAESGARSGRPSAVGHHRAVPNDPVGGDS